MYDPSWTKEQTLALISEWKKYKELHNPSVRDVYTKHANYFKQILEKVKIVRPDITMCALRRQMDFLRVQMWKSFNQRDQSIWCYKELDFLPLYPSITSISFEESNKKSVPWSQNESLTLIREWRKYPSLYEPDQPGCVDLNKQKDYDILFKVMEPVKRLLTLDDMKNQMNNLRTQWSQSKNVQLADTQSWVMDELKFLSHFDQEKLDILENNSKKENQNNKKDAEYNPPWTRSETLTLISIWKKYENKFKALNDQFEPDSFECCQGKTALYKEIVLNLKPYKPYITTNNVKQKIGSLRSQMLRALKNKLDAKPTFWAFDELKFLYEETTNDTNKIQQGEVSTTTSSTTEIIIPEEKSIETRIPFIQHSLQSITDAEATSKKRRKSAQNLKSSKTRRVSSQSSNSQIISTQPNEQKRNVIEGKEKEFCLYLCSEMKKVELYGTLEKLKVEILKFVNNAVKQERQLTDVN